MANYWAITIGINQYRHLQPLMHAQNDALFMHRFFTETAGIPADNCVLLSDLATSVGHQVVYPDKPALSEWVQTITQRVQSDDVLWFFFSGYGVQLEGADYLMPIDGDPGQVAQTGLAASDLIDTLSQLPTEKALLVLDINRSQGSFSGQAIGQQVIDLAEDRQLPLLLSCQPEQYSHETFGVRHGLFTAALLEALQQKCTTLSEINAYVNKRLPELCEHHWRPIQNPVGLVSAAQASTVVIPESRLVADVASSPVSAEAGADKGLIVAGAAGLSGVGASAAAGAAAMGSEAVNTEPTEKSTVLAGSTGTLLSTTDLSNSEPSNSEPLDSIANPTANKSFTNGRSTARGRRNKSSLDPSSAIVPAGKNEIVSTGESSGTSAISGARLRNWGLAALAVLMLGVLLKQPFMLTAWQGLSERITAIGGRSGEEEVEETSPETTQSEGAVTPAEETAEGGAEGPAAAPAEESPDEQAGAGEAGVDEAATGETAAESPEETAAADPATAAAPTNTSAPNSGTAENVQTDEATKALLAQANASLTQRQYSEALITLQQVPKDQRDSAFSTLLTKARAGAAEAQQFNASVLTVARTSIQQTQASQFTDAISKARLIQPGEPYYEAAQADIRSWSQIILDIAEGRATSGNLEGAIAAANVMPYDNAEFYQKSKERIAFWKQRQQSREIIQAAQAIPRSGQASTYQEGIVRLGEVPIEHPEYETAQRLADEWSDRIFSIAQARAAQGRREAAIQAAVLVPAGTTSYEPTQQAIKRWRAEE